MTTYIALFNLTEAGIKSREGLAAPALTPPRSYLPTWAAR